MPQVSCGNIWHSPLNYGYIFFMPFSHYVKIRRILEQQPEGWVIKRIDSPTSAKNFKGELVSFSYYYRIYDCNQKPMKYCKFQQIDLLARTLRLPVEALPVIEQAE